MCHLLPCVLSRQPWAKMTNSALMELGAIWREPDKQQWTKQIQTVQCFTEHEKSVALSLRKRIETQRQGRQDHGNNGHDMSDTKTQKMVERDRNISVEVGSELLPGAPLKSQLKKKDPLRLSLSMYIYMYISCHIYLWGRTWDSEYGPVFDILAWKCLYESYHPMQQIYSNKNIWKNKNYAFL